MKKMVFALTVFLLLSPAFAGAWDIPGKDLMQKIGIPGQGEKPAADKAAASTSTPSPASETPPAAAETTSGTSPAAVPAEKPAAAIPGISPDQADANACSQYVHEDYKKEQQDLKTTKLTWGSARYLAKKEWVDHLKARYPNVKREKNDFYIHFGKWFGKSCAYVDLKCVPKEPGCTATMKCLDFYTRKGGNTCPPNLCSFNDKKCIEPYKYQGQ